jgi:hypothetical protein
MGMQAMAAEMPTSMTRDGVMAATTATCDRELRVWRGTRIHCGVRAAEGSGARGAVVERTRVMVKNQLANKTSPRC